MKKLSPGIMSPRTSPRLLLAVLVMLLACGGSDGVRLVRLTVINKSGMELEVRLSSNCSYLRSLGVKASECPWYVLHVPEGDRYAPSETVFTIVREIYAASVDYLEIWDPVYGYSCSSNAAVVQATSNARLVVLECDRRAPNRGEPTMVKAGGGGRQPR
ncbi:MAG: hypothetical protein JXB15_02235 [Anaerolineales bacterium]|nr:hypothetical protein [Anaerolineales bacterium]